MVVVIIFPVILQTVINFRMLSIEGRGIWWYEWRKPMTLTGVATRKSTRNSNDVSLSTLK